MSDAPDLTTWFAGSMSTLCGAQIPAKFAVAVSGGGDSMALLHLVEQWARAKTVTLSVVTIDHQLRPESGAEAALVKQVAVGLGLTHTTLRWDGWDGQGNLPDAAREARLSLIDNWRGDVRHVLMAHTQDDQAETFLMRLRRGSGVDGLSGMSANHFIEHRDQSSSDWRAGRPNVWHVLRPLLAMSRKSLRSYLTDIKAEWVEDQSNSDLRYERVRMRQLMPTLEAAGLYQKGLAQTAKHLRRARTALRRRAQDVAQKIARQEDGDVVFDLVGLRQVEEETQLRLLAAALCWVSSNLYRPRLSGLESCLHAALNGSNSVLHGGLIRVDGTNLTVTREYQAARDARHIAGQHGFWDGRWKISGPAIEGADIRALGVEGVRQIGSVWKNRPNQAVILSKPGLFRGNQLLACQSA
ncbi:MAG: tRNA lysidine(34) synthetase TilS, partial [Paracoccaceae bacterium]|nr:tRNA lysidine(34) synthetase TilS [Paracoccaceae bacterium]